MKKTQQNLKSSTMYIILSLKSPKVLNEILKIKMLGLLKRVS